MNRLPLIASLALHAAVLLSFLQPVLPRHLPERSKSEYQQAIAGHEKQILWYRFKKELPDVSPVSKAEKKLPLKAEIKAKQSIVSAPKAAVKRTQMVWAPAPEIAQPKPVESANLLAIKMPEVTAPQAKPFVAPPDILKPDVAGRSVPLSDAPAVQARALIPEFAATLPKVAKPFTRPPVRARVQPPKSIVPPPDVPDLAASFDSSLPEVFRVPMAAPRRPFKGPPSASVTGRGTRTIHTEAPPDVSATGSPAMMNGNNKQLDLAVVGLNPSDRTALPSGSSPAEFSAGAVVRKDGATSTGDAKGINVPDIFVHGARDAKPDLIARAYAPATSSGNIREAMRHSDVRTRDAPETPPSKMNGAIPVSNAPDPRFQGRDVFMMAIQMPNLTSYSGSWLMWYAERSARERGLGDVAPPIAHRKVDPKYVATAVEERVQGRVQLACVIKRDGTVASVEVVRGIDDRLNRSAGDALAKWEFSPAMRNGEAIDVDVLVEIPFQLAPQIKKP